MNRSGCSWSERLEIGVTSCCVDWLQLADLIHPLQRKQPLSKMVLLVWCKIWEELRFFVMSLYKWGTCLAKKKKKTSVVIDLYTRLYISALHLSWALKHMSFLIWEAQHCVRGNLPVVIVTQVYNIWLQTISTQVRVTGKTTHCIII